MNSSMSPPDFSQGGGISDICTKKSFKLVKPLTHLRVFVYTYQERNKRYVLCRALYKCQ